MLHIDNKIMDLGPKFGPRGSKMEVLGGGIFESRSGLGAKVPQDVLPRGAFCSF